MQWVLGDWTNSPLNAHGPTEASPSNDLLGCPRKLGSMVSKLGKYLLIHGVYWGYNPLILTLDPNFLGHPNNGLM